MYWFDSLLARFYKYPDWVLVVVWVVYTGLDFLSAVILGLEIDFRYSLLNLFFGFGFSLGMYYWFLPQILIKGDWKTGSLYVLVFVLILTWIKLELLFPDAWVWEVDFGQVWLEWMRLLHFQGLTLLLWGLFAYRLLQQDNLRKNALLGELEIQQRYMQLGPHFVLNMLSEISESAKGSSPKLSEEIDQFSYLLRYSYKSLEAPNSLLDEILALKAYDYCQRQRFGERINVALELEYPKDVAAALPLPKMAFLTLFLDVFKHGDYLGDHPCEVGLKLTVSPETGNRLVVFRIFNKNGGQKHLLESGFGLKAVSGVLAYYFDEDFRMDYTKSESDFSLLLTIDYGS